METAAQVCQNLTRGVRFVQSTVELQRIAWNYYADFRMELTQDHQKLIQAFLAMLTGRRELAERSNMGMMREMTETCLMAELYFIDKVAPSFDMSSPEGGNPGTS